MTRAASPPPFGQPPSSGRARWLPNPLATRRGRLGSFFLLYITEGVPLGFTATAVATYMRRQGVPAEHISVFVGSLYLPWSWKWLFGPLADTLYSERLGRRRGWIIGAQLAMAATLLAAAPVDFSQRLKLFALVVLAHNVFGAAQDVAIDALACAVLREDERGLANGLMFGGAWLGQALGGSGVLFLTPWTGFQATFFFVAGSILAVTALVAAPMREPPSPPRPAAAGGPLAAAAGQIRQYAATALRAFIGSRGAICGALFALLPAGGYGLSLALSSNLAVELGLTDNQIAQLTLAVTVLSAAFCVLGGYLSDRFGRRRMMGLYIAGTAIPTLGLAAALYRHGWIMPVDPTAAARPLAPPSLIAAFWAASLLFAVFNGLLYGTRTALFMDICTPAVAATQFTAYMAMLNFVIFYSGVWQGAAIARWGYPATLAIDGLFGMVCLAVLPWVKPSPK